MMNTRRQVIRPSAWSALAGLVLLAAGAAADQPRQPLDGALRRFMAYDWSSPAGAYDNIVPFFWVTRSTTPEQAKAATDAMPAGHRVLFIWNLHHGISTHPEDRCQDAAGNLTDYPGVWWEHGVQENARRFDDFFKRYHAIGGQLDTLVLDHEIGLSRWTIRDEQQYRAIMADPRFDEIAAQLGFRDLMTVMHYYRQSGKERTHYRVFNAVMHERAANYMNQAFYEPVRKYYPDVKLSNYGYFDGKPPHTAPNKDGGDYHPFSTGAAMHVGTHQSKHVYCTLRQITARTMPGGFRPYGSSPFAGFRLGVNQMRSMTLSGDVPVAPWISHKRYGASAIWYTDLYQELIFHVGLCDPEVFLLWNPYCWRKDESSGELIDVGLQTRLVSDCLNRLDELVGAADRRTRVEELAGWYDELVLSGMTAGGRSVWRLTPRLFRGQRRDETLVTASPAVFRVGATEIRIPGGSVWRPERELSGQGFWVLAPADAQPAVTTDWAALVTEDDRADATDMLKAFGLDGDSLLAVDTLSRAERAALPNPWFLADADGDRRLGLAELAVARRWQRYDEAVLARDADPHRLHGLARHLRARYDRNKDLFLDRFEWQPAGAQLTELGPADADTSGEVSHLELVDWLDVLREADGEVAADQRVTPAVVSDAVHTYTNDRPRVVVPQSGIASEITIDDDYRIADLDVRLSVSMFNQQQLDLSLSGPDGELVPLYSGKLKPWEQRPIFEDTLLDDEAAEITATLPRPPRRRAFRPEGVGRAEQASLSSFYGRRPAGTWRLLIHTGRSNQAALLHSWSLLVRASAAE